MKKTFCYQYKNDKFIINELKQIARSRQIKGYQSMSKERLLSALNE